MRYYKITGGKAGKEICENPKQRAGDLKNQ